MSVPQSLGENKTFTKEEKAKRLKVAQEHQDADRFVQGRRLISSKLGDGIYRGCFLGCMMQKMHNVESTASNEMNLPERMVWLGEKLFEGLPPLEATLFPVQLLEAIPTDTNMLQVWKNFMYRLLMDEKRGTIIFAKGNPKVSSIVREVAKLYKMKTIADNDNYRTIRAAAHTTKTMLYPANYSATAMSAAVAYGAARSSNYTDDWAYSSIVSYSDTVTYAAHAASYVNPKSHKKAEDLLKAIDVKSKAHYQRMRDVLLEELYNSNK